ncbi:Methionyl-tRNA formyltransferase [Coemansia sp. RSA 988]|nr:Methionyl-tRNA formyltransferase [Coemansia sp. RSA 988]
MNKKLAVSLLHYARIPDLLTMLTLIRRQRSSVPYLRRAWQSTVTGIQGPARDTGSTSSRRKKLSVMVFGSDDFAAGIVRRLDNFVKSKDSCLVNVEVACPTPKLGTLSKREEKKGAFRKENLTPIHEAASELFYKVHARSPQSLTGWAVPEPRLRRGDIDNVETIGVVCYSHLILPERLARSFTLGMLQIHPSLLPRHRGETPIQTAILRDDESTGVTIAEYSFKSSCSGKILAQIPYKLNRTSKYSEVKQILAHLGGDLLGTALENLTHLRAHAIVQNEYKATYTRKFNNDDLTIDWEKMSAADIYRRYRAFYGLMCLHTIWRKKDKMHKLMLLNMYTPDPDVPLMQMNVFKYAPGTMFYINKVPYLEVPCVDGNRIHLLNLLVEGRTPKAALEFVNGYLRTSGALRMLTAPVEPKKPTPKFEYAADHPNYKTGGIKNIEKL